MKVTTWLFIIAVAIIATAITVWCIKPTPAPVEVEKIVTVYDTIKITDTKYKVITSKGKIVYQDKVITWEDTSKIASLESILAQLGSQTHTEIQYVDRVKIVNKVPTWGWGLTCGPWTDTWKPGGFSASMLFRYHKLIIEPGADWKDYPKPVRKRISIGMMF